MTPPPAGDITGRAEGVVEPVNGDLHHLPQRLVITHHHLEDQRKVTMLSKEAAGRRKLL